MRKIVTFITTSIALLFCFFGSCSFCYATSAMNADVAIIRKVTELYRKQSNRITNSFRVDHPVFFCQTPDSVLWNRSIISKNPDGIIRIDIPVISRDVHMMMVQYYDGRRHYHTICFHCLTAFIDKDSGKQSLFNHYIIPYRSWESAYMRTPPTGKEYLEWFEALATSQIQNGIEVYSTLDGYIVEFNRYNEGRRYEHITGNTADRFRQHQTFSYRMSTKLSMIYTRGYIFNTSHSTKSNGGADNTCSECGAELELFGEWGFVCPSCGEAFLYDNELDGSHCYDDYYPYMPWGSDESLVQPDNGDGTGWFHL